MTSVIGLTGAIPVLLGDNIGTTITALLPASARAATPSAWRCRTACSIFRARLIFICSFGVCGIRAVHFAGRP
ncbi:MAG: hypothetical protein ACLT98_06375 [Eggerthellaceae bacterium]